MKSILYIEDEPDDVFFIQRAFKQTGIEQSLQTVSDGEQAIAYLSGESQYVNRVQYPTPALVLLDLNMPRMSGFEVLKWIRSTSPMSIVPIVILTSSNQKKDIHQASSLGANGYLVKPGKPEALVEMVRALKDYWLVHDRLVVRAEIS